MVTLDNDVSAVAAQPLTAEVLAWLADQRQLQRAEADIVADMVKSGWRLQVAQQAVYGGAGPFVGLPPGVAASPQAGPPGGPAQQLPGPRPALQLGQNGVEIDGHRFKVLLSMASPEVAMFEGFLSPEECQGLMELSRERLDRSQIVSSDGGQLVVDTARTSDGMFFNRGESALVQRIEARIATLLNWPVSHGEGLQVLRYRPGAEYRAHYDYFDPTLPASHAVLARGGQRVGTLLMYLAAPPRGGATIFPDAGLDVAPVAGNALFFGYPQPHPSSRTLHGGAPVIEGEKWVATKWLREREY